jgi:tripartite-type tricarboxylate transporter receptor subunit TctC
MQMKPFQRRQFLFLAGGAGLLPAVSRVAWAQTYPTRPVHVIVGFPVGGGIDIVARLVGKWLSDRLGQPFDVENRTGAGSNIATEAVVRAPADGYTLLLATAANAISPALNPNLSFNFIRDTAPVAGVSRIPIFMVVAPFSPFKTVSDFTAHAKANLSRTSIGTTFAGTPVFLAAALFKSMAGLDVPLVHHPSDAAGLADLQAGKVQVHFAGAGAVTEDIKAGKLRALGVTTLMRSELLPAVPTIADTVPGYEVSSWAGFAAPRATPPEIIDRLNREINLGLADAQVKARLAELGHEPMPMTSAEFGKFVAAETEKWGKVVKLAGIKPQ